MTAFRVSIGVASLYKGSGLDFEELVNRADKALYQAKGTGRNAVYVADAQTDDGSMAAPTQLDLGGGI